MPRISIYPKDTSVSGNDIWIGSDGDDGLITKNFSPDSLAKYFNDNNLFNQNTYQFVQSSAASTWVIDHNLSKFPSVTVVDSGNNIVIGDITYNDLNTLTINFTASFSGKAYLN